MLHLIHPALIHFTIAFVVVGGLCEVAGLLARRPAWGELGGALLLVGLASLVPTVVSGYLAANTLEFGERAHDLLARHERDAWIVLGLLLASQFWKAWCRGRLGPRARAVYALLVAAAVAWTVHGALLGGRMVYLEGVGVR